MTKGKWYSPQLQRQIVRRLYLKAKAERIPMTVLVNRLIEQALDPNGLNNTPIAKENNADLGPE